MPLVPYNDVLMTKGQSCETTRSFDQYHPLKSVAVRDEVDHRFLLQDPFFLLQGSLRMSLLSWAQMIDYVAEDVRVSNDELVVSMEELGSQLQQLRFNTSAVNRAKERLLDGLELVRQGGSPSWPKATEQDIRERKALIQSRLGTDYEFLIQRCELLIQQCNSVIDILVGFSQAATAERAIQQSAEVRHLTRIATIFLPLSFATGIFGMNITEWQPAVNVHWFIVVLGFVLLLVLLMLNPRNTFNYGLKAVDKIKSIRCH